MFCDACGTELNVSQSFCPRCGKQIMYGLHIAHPQPGRVQQHIRLLGILWLALSALNSVGGFILFVLANTLFHHQWPSMPSNGGPPAFLHPFLSFIAVLILIKAALGFAAGWGLLQRESWARILTLVVAFLALFNVPLGTALGIYSLWVLLPAQSDREYEEQVRAA
jgi:hypothetical protein